MFLPHVWFGDLRWIVGERLGTVDRRASSRVHVTRAPMAAWPFSHHLGQNGLTNWAGSWGAGPPVRGQCWLPWGWECVRLKVLGWPPPCLVPDTTPVVTQWHLRGGECPAPQQWKIRTTLLGAFRIAGSGLWPGGQHTHSTHWTLGMDTRSLSLGGPGTGGEVGRLQVDTSGPHLCGQLRSRAKVHHHGVGTAWGWH